MLKDLQISEVLSPYRSLLSGPPSCKLWLPWSPPDSQLCLPNSKKLLSPTWILLHCAKTWKLSRHKLNNHMALLICFPCIRKSSFIVCVQCLETIFSYIFICYFYQVDSGGRVNQLPAGPSCPEAEVRNAYFDKGTQLSVHFFPFIFFPSSSCEPCTFTVTQDRLDLVLIM